MATSTTLPIRTAVLGYGLAGRVFHCPFVDAVPGLELATILQRHGDTAAAAYPSAHIARSLEEVLADPAIDLIVVATPNDTHFDLASAALRAGKHVVVDKPLATSSQHARELIDLAQAQGKVLAPFHNRRFDGDFLTLSQLVSDNTLGRIVTISSHYDRFRPIQRPGTWKEAGGHGNGILFDLGPHLIDQAIALFGIPTHLTASVRHERDVTAIEDAFDVTLDFALPSGHALRYTCSASMLAADPSPRFHVHGTHGSYLKYGLDPQEPALLAGTRPPQLGSATPWLPEPESAWGTLILATQRTEPVQLTRTPHPTIPGDYRRFYASVQDAIRGLGPLAIPPEDAFRTIRILELALQSSAEHRTLPIDFA